MLNARARRELAITAQITPEEEIQVDAQCQDIVPKVVTVEVPGIQGPPGKDGAPGKDGEDGQDGPSFVERIDNSFIDNLF